VGRFEHADVQRIIVMMAQLGMGLGQAIAAVTDAETSGNAPIALLFTLDLDGPQRPGAIQEITGLTSSGVTRLLDRMEASGLVTRRSGDVDGDRRGVLVALTPAGRRQSRRMASAASAWMDAHRIFLKELSDFA
jgi:DNA-binding MarR family transcriptional regulator